MSEPIRLFTYGDLILAFSTGFTLALMFSLLVQIFLDEWRRRKGNNL